ncbi:hypothetical protein J3459_020917 [Metarhizium acridum]|nr:hypothetical protein J3459_020917 [Metarhizium acridum]
MLNFDIVKYSIRLKHPGPIHAACKSALQHMKLRSRRFPRVHTDCVLLRRHPHAVRLARDNIGLYRRQLRPQTALRLAQYQFPGRANTGIVSVVRIRSKRRLCCPKHEACVAAVGGRNLDVG